MKQPVWNSASETFKNARFLLSWGYPQIALKLLKGKSVGNCRNKWINFKNFICCEFWYWCNFTDAETLTSFFFKNQSCWKYFQFSHCGVLLTYFKIIWKKLTHLGHLQLFSFYLTLALNESHSHYNEKNFAWNSFLTHFNSVKVAISA